MLDRQLIQRIAGAFPTDEVLVEKDWYIVRAIGMIASLDHAGATPVFSGGTSLSKGWGLIKRFSEDMDFKVAMPKAASGAASRNKRRAFRERFSRPSRRTNSSFWARP
ncbi:MAG TPA: nucleotidyl transferase AbiEii/AbiGii toxin family protein [Deltaproteobacteria bacterium]|nr:nucleotidyl transferase AbiEii/AbiGii toxin family protein [Deltaproteobacteria bacterium]